MLTILREEQGKHPAGSDLQKLLCWCELHIADQFDALSELEDEAKLLREQNDSLRVSVLSVLELMHNIKSYFNSETFVFDTDQFTKDFAPWINIMAANGMKPDGSPLRKRKRQL